MAGCVASLARALLPCGALGAEQLVQEVGQTLLALGGGIGDRWPLGGEVDEL